jgi:hypothetical protein
LKKLFTSRRESLPPEEHRHQTFEIEKKSKARKEKEGKARKPKPVEKENWEQESKQTL